MMYDFSEGTEAVFNRVIRDRVMNDDRNVVRNGEKDWLGYSFNLIRDTIAASGLADFTQGFKSESLGDLSALDRCLLYSFIYARKHCRQSRDLLARCAAEAGLPAAEPTLFLDLGCGPATALMAYADTFPNVAIDYIAVDRAKGMTDLAKEIFEGLVQEGVIAATSTFRSEASCRAVSADSGKPTVIAASFLFASSSLPGERDSLCDLVTKLFQGNNDKGIAFIYTNSNKEIAGREWVEFTKKMNWSPEVISLDVDGDPKMGYVGNVFSNRRKP